MMFQSSKTLCAVILVLAFMATADRADAGDRDFYYATPEGQFLYLGPSNKPNHIYGSLIIGSANVSGDFEKVAKRLYILSDVKTGFEDSCRISLIERDEGTVFDVEVDQDTSCKVSGMDLSGVSVKGMRLAPGPDRGRF